MVVYILLSIILGFFQKTSNLNKDQSARYTCWTHTNNNSIIHGHKPTCRHRILLGRYNILHNIINQQRMSYRKVKIDITIITLQIPRLARDDNRENRGHITTTRKKDVMYT